MKLLEFKTQINAPADKVWKVLFTQDENRNWPSAVNEGTCFEGNWEEGSVMRFLDDADHLKLKEVAKKEDRSLNYLINQAIKKFLREESAKA